MEEEKSTSQESKTNSKSDLITKEDIDNSNVVITKELENLIAEGFAEIHNILKHTKFVHNNLNEAVRTKKSINRIKNISKLIKKMGVVKS